MDRINVLQRVIAHRSARTYLEIGVSAGNTFLRLEARKKIAVDPKIKIRRTKRLLFTLINPCNRFNEYCEMTSDRFFETKSHLLAERGLDVAFVDGLHTYEQALRDVEKSLGHLNPGGVIVMHDCNPPHEAAAHPARSLEHAQSLNLPGWTNEWCGDTFKALVHLRSTRDDLNVFTFDCDYGLGVVMKGSPETTLDYTPAQIENMRYAELAADRERILNLKTTERFDEWLQSI